MVTVGSVCLQACRCCVALTAAWKTPGCGAGGGPWAMRTAWGRWDGGCSSTLVSAELLFAPRHAKPKRSIFITLGRKPGCGESSGIPGVAWLSHPRAAVSARRRAAGEGPAAAPRARGAERRPGGLGLVSPRLCLSPGTAGAAALFVR